MRSAAPVVEVEGLKQGRESRVRDLLALGEVAAVDDANLDHDPEEHGDHSDDAREDPADEVENEEVGGVPCPEDRVGQLPSVAEDDAVAEEDDTLDDDNAQNRFEDEPDGQVRAESQGNDVHEPGGEHAQGNKEDISEDEVLGIGGCYNLQSKEMLARWPRHALTTRRGHVPCSRGQEWSCS
jgi:hypothetical protein